MPFIVSWGDRLTPTVSDFIGYFPDVMPTLADIAGLRGKDVPQSDGVSFLPTLQGRKQPQHPYLYWEFPLFKGGNGWLCVRMGEWKGLVEDVVAGNTKMQLYRINEDPREEHDLASQYPEVVEKMWKAIAESHTQNANPLFNLDITFPKR